MNTTTSTPTTDQAPDRAPDRSPSPAGRFSLTRTAHLTRWNSVLLGRNRLALVYGLVLPLTSLLLLLTGDRGEKIIGVSALGGVLLLTGLFPVYYNILSQFVSRRDELVLKRMRTGEIRDSELLLGIALPGVAIAMAVCTAAVPIAVAMGQPLPLNAILFGVGALITAAMFAGFAYWTAAWTRSAEAAQLTSMPVIILTAIGPIGMFMTSLPDTLRDAISYTPGAAMTQLVQIGWYGFDGIDATRSTLTFTETWGAATGPLAVMLAWTIVALALASRSMRWEPRS